ncbi:MAG TPA: macro domain-containing protein [bacterium]|nr:macro domain-containing protein [bacterium]
MKININRKTLELKHGDITREKTDAIVNAANSQLIMGGGVAGAIRMAGGPKIQEDCYDKAPCPVGGAAITTAGRLPSKYVIHAVGPRWGEGDEDNKLRDAVISSFKTADSNGLRSISLPAISTGIFGFPLQRAAHIMIRAAADHLNSDTNLELVRFVLFSKRDMDVFEKEVATLDNA